VTPQAVLMEAHPEFAITQSPGCMFVTDQLVEDSPNPIKRLSNEVLI
jgi:hypothetical protein